MKSKDLSRRSGKARSIARDELTPYNVGLLRLFECKINPAALTETEVKLIGLCSIYRVNVVVGTLNGVWRAFVSDTALRGFKVRFRIWGKKVFAVQPKAQPNPLDMMKPGQIFAMCQYQPQPPKRMKIKARVQIANAFRMEKY